MDGTILLGLVVAICGASGPIALIIALVQNRGERKRHKEELAKLRFEAIDDERKRQDEMSNSLIKVISALIPRIDNIVEEIHSSNDTENKRLELREHDLNEQRTITRDQTRIVSANTAVLTENVQQLVSLKLASMESAKQILEKVDKMEDKLSEKLKPLDEQLAEQTKQLSTILQSIETLRLTIEEKLNPVPTQFQEIHDAVQAIRNGINTTSVSVVQASEAIVGVRDYIDTLILRLQALPDKPKIDPIASPGDTTHDS